MSDDLEGEDSTLGIAVIGMAGVATMLLPETQHRSLITED